MKKIFIASFCLLMSACLQGPWSYRPEAVEIDRGIHVNAYIVAQRPITDVCFERLYALDETSTDAFSFFDSAEVSVEGDFGSGQETLVLASKPGKPMCFVGPSTKLGLAGNSYELEGVFYWDSAGQAVESRLLGTAHIPTSLSVDTLAWANSLALSQDFEGASQDDVFGLFNSLPDSVANYFADKYLPELTPIADDSVELTKWYAENGQTLMRELDSLLAIYEQFIQYAEYDTVAYLSGALNTTSHYYKLNVSDDVAGILVTQELDSNRVVPKNRFDEIVENFTELTATNYFYPNERRRLIYYERFQNEEFDIMDSLPVVNTWFAGGTNVIYFYASDSSYKDYVKTTVEEEDNSKVKKASFIEGGTGYFTGMLVDSFVVNIRIPANADSYHIFEAHASWCNDNDWDNKNCREFLFDYCREVKYNDRQFQFENPAKYQDKKSFANCLDVLGYDALNRGQTVEAAIDSLFPNDQIRFKARVDGMTIDSSFAIDPEEKTVDIESAKTWYCIENNFADDFCAPLKSRCINEEPVDLNCTERLYNYCLDNLWQGDACEWGLHLYCQQSTINSEILCGSRNNNFCLNNPQDEVCKK